MSKKIFDAHIHFNIPEKIVDCDSLQVYDDLQNTLKQANVDNCLLIINSDKERSVYAQIIQKGIKFPYYTASCIDFKNQNSISFYEKFLFAFGSKNIKIHPRLSNLSVSEITNIIWKLKNVEFENVIVDAFGYGHSIKNHIGIELAIEIASAYPDKKVIIAHSGGERLLECFLYTRDLSNIYYDISLTCTYLKGTHVEQDLIHMMKYNSSKIVFGSDYPDFTPEEALNSILDMCNMADLNEEQVQNILYNNALSIYS